MNGPVVARVPDQAPQAAQQPAANQAPAAQAAQTAPEKGPEKSPFQTALQGTTLVTITSTPNGAEVRDTDDRLIGQTPFELAVPQQKPLQVTLKLDGFKPYVIKQKSVSGERLSFAANLKKDPKADLGKIVDQVPGKRSVGYKDDPY
ncbi:MAG: PEGA domain-containing protein [Deltaproteobacteria bacterium]|nr:PEGA domain-containing protein [Deltaproteobacteria bacterium]